MVSWVELEIEIGRFSKREGKSLETNGLPTLCQARGAGRSYTGWESLGLGKFFDDFSKTVKDSSNLIFAF